MFKAKEIRLKTKEDIVRHLNEERVKLRDLNFKKAGSQVKNFNEFKIVRKNIAILSTVLKELRNK